MVKTDEVQIVFIVNEAGHVVVKRVFPGREKLSSDVDVLQCATDRRFLLGTDRVFVIRATEVIREKEE
jgi:hypothetical protein